MGYLAEKGGSLGEDPGAVAVAVVVAAVVVAVVAVAPWGMFYVLNI